MLEVQLATHTCSPFKTIEAAADSLQMGITFVDLPVRTKPPLCCLRHQLFATSPLPQLLSPCLALVCDIKRTALSKWHSRCNWITSYQHLYNWISSCSTLSSNFDVYLRDWQFVCLTVYLWFPARLLVGMKTASRVDLARLASSLS